MIIRWTSPPLIPQIPSLHKFATVTPFHVPLLRRGIIITSFHGFGINCMVSLDWDSAPRCVCGFISNLSGESPFFPAASTLLLHTICVRSWCTCRASCVAARHAKNEIKMSLCNNNQQERLRVVCSNKVTVARKRLTKSKSTPTMTPFWTFFGLPWTHEGCFAMMYLYVDSELRRILILATFTF